MARRVRFTRTAISPRLATRTVSNIRSSHPEDAVAELAQRRVGARGEGEPEHGAGLRGIDDAVVPEAGGGVVRVTLVIVMLTGRRLARPFIPGPPLPAAGPQPLAAHRRPDAGR